MPAHMQKAEQFSALPFCFNPRNLEIILEPPIPKRLANALRNMKTGIASVAATCAGSLSCPAKNVSVSFFFTDKHSETYYAILFNVLNS